MNDQNRHYSCPAQKVAILREHLIEGRAVSICATSTTSTRRSFTSGRDNCPQSNGKIERWHQCLKADYSGVTAHFPSRMLPDLSSASFTTTTVRLHSAIGYVTPADRLGCRHLEIFYERDRKLELARQKLETKRQSLTESIIASTSYGKAPIFHFSLNQDNLSF
jgi:hypothetical protein